MRSRCWVFALATIAFSAELGAQSPSLSPAYALGSGPRVSIDRAHFNLHTREGPYRPFAELLARDGYVLQSNAEPFSEESLARTNVLVISNALAGPLSDEEIRRLPARSAFLDSEIEAVYRWVSDDGGSLLLIADHMPFPGAVEKLAMRFGIYVHNGYAGTRGAPNPLVFALSDSSLKDHSITRGRSSAERVPFVATFGGHAFGLHSDLDASPLMVFAAESTVYLTEEMLTGEGTITPQTPRIPADGLFQGAALKVGRGKVFMSGEAAMFSAQVAPDGSSYGFNHTGAPHNSQFVLNVLHWLSGILDEESLPIQ
jgi:hypothetical protein